MAQATDGLAEPAPLSLLLIQDCQLPRPPSAGSGCQEASGAGMWRGGAAAPGWDVWMVCAGSRATDSNHCGGRHEAETM